MNKTRILYTSAQVRKSVIGLFASAKGRRVAIVAFVGKGAEAYLPRPNGLELVCWPKAGGTNPHVLRKLMRRGVQITFVDSLHMKLYWAEDKGSIVTSANLSTRALGAGNLRELGVFLPSGQLDIEQILSSIGRRPVSAKELRQLDRLHHEYEVQMMSDRRKARACTFTEWYKLPFRPTWKLGWWDTYSMPCSNAKRLTREEYEVSEPHNYLDCDRTDYKNSDWVLTFRLKGQSVSAIRWMPVDHVVSVHKSDKAYSKEYPYQAIQVWPLNRYPAPPFHIDPRFRAAFSKATRELGTNRIKALDRTKPSKRFIDFIFRDY
ncbi:MAG: phospholipase D family protein [Chloroflexi bacterium]|nr:phospholipase D family protein [Chloroflexota bacterium]